MRPSSRNEPPPHDRSGGGSEPPARDRPGGEPAAHDRPGGGSEPPAHHRPGGGFRNPWPDAEGDDARRKLFRRVAWEWLTTSLPPNPGPGELPVADPDPSRPRAADELRLTWVGHSTFLVQLPGLNLLTDPVWSPRVSPVSFVGNKRFVPAAPPLDELPPIDGVLISHDHYDHLDVATVRALHERFGDSTTWFTPLGYRAWFAKLGVERVVERDWWDEAEAPGGGYRVVAAPARHWTRRTPWSTNARLWCSWAVLSERAEGYRTWFAGDSGFGSFFGEIGARLGPFDASIVPVGAYEPRWFMRASHMNPEEAVEVYRRVGGRGAFVPGHWGTFRLTFEPPLEPPERTRAAWTAAGLPEKDLRMLRHGQTTVVRKGG